MSSPPISVTEGLGAEKPKLEADFSGLNRVSPV